MSHPLLCWDVCMEGIQRRINLAEDLKTLQKIKKKYQWDTYPCSLDNALIWENKVIIITDAKLNIVHATENIFGMNGYKLNEVIGKSPKIFQGKKTEAKERKLIGLAIESKQNFETIITNYRKDGSIYKCHIEGYPIFNDKGKLVNFVALENVA